MAAWDVLILDNVTVQPDGKYQLRVPGVGETYNMPRDVAVTGNISVTGTVDGRDVASDGALAASALQPTNIDTLAELNAIITDATLIDTGDARLSDARTPTAHNQAWSTITSTPTTLAGYGITDAESADATIVKATITTIASGELLKWNGTAWINNTLAEAGIQPAGSYLTSETSHTDVLVDGDFATAGLMTTDGAGAYSITATATFAAASHNQAWSTITSTPTTLAGYGITDSLSNIAEDLTPQLGGSLDVNGQKIVSVAGGNIDIEPNGTGNVLLGNFTFNADATIGAGQDNFVLTYDNATGLWGPEAAAAGAGDFKADGTVDMTGEFRTDVGTFDSDVADGAAAVAYSYDTQVSYSTAGAKLASWKNNTTEKAFITKNGVIGTADSTGATFQGMVSSGNGCVAINTSGIAPSGMIQSVMIGPRAAENATLNADQMVAIGYQALRYASGGGNVGIGLNAVSDGAFSGAYNTAVGYGTFCTPSTINYGKAFGYNSQVAHHHGFAMAGEQFDAKGDNQFLILQPANTTTDETPTILYLDEDGASKRMTVASGKLYAFEAHVVGVQSDGTDAAYYTRKGIIANNAGTAALIGTVQTVGTDIESNAACDVGITADDTNDALIITVTGIAAETWRWSANVMMKEITIGT